MFYPYYGLYNDATSILSAVGDCHRLAYLVFVQDAKNRKEYRCNLEKSDFKSCMLCENDQCKEMYDCIKYLIEKYYADKENPHITIQKPCKNCGKEEFSYKNRTRETYYWPKEQANMPFRKKNIEKIEEYKKDFTDYCGERNICFECQNKEKDLPKEGTVKNLKKEKSWVGWAERWFGD